AVIKRIKIPTKTANIVSFSVRSEFSAQTTGICPKTADNGSPDEANTNEPTTKDGSRLLAILCNSPIAKVGLTRIDNNPVSGWMFMESKLDSSQLLKGCQIPA